MLPLRPNPETGFLESNKLVSFSSDCKVKFLALAQECVDRGQMPGVPMLCKAVGIALRTFDKHKAEDEKFAEAWEEILDECEQTLVSTMYANGQRPQGFMDRIAWLRSYRPQRWNPDTRVQIMRDFAGEKPVIDAAKGAVDAEIIENTTAKRLQDGEKP